MPRRRLDDFLTSCANPVALLGIAVVAAGIYLGASVRADPDLWGHLTFGRDIVEAGGVVRTDPYSFASDREWVNHEWLAEVILHAAWSGAGAPGLMLLKLVIVSVALALLWRRSRRLDVEARLALLAIALWSAANRVLTARPQIFSLLCFAVLLLLLDSLRRRPPAVVLTATAALFALWANLHGGWIVGLGVTVVWAAATVMERQDRIPAALAMPAAALAGSLATPYGFAKWRFLVETVGPHRPAIADWLPAWSATGLLAAWLVPAAAAVWALTRRPRPSLPSAAVMLALGALALRVSRLDMFFGLAAAWMICTRFDGRTIAVPKASADPSRGARAVMCGATMAAAVLVFIVVGRELGNNARCIPMASSDTPYPEAQAIAILQNRAPGERVFTFFDYGEYAIWHLAPQHTVSMDGRRETVYSDRTVARHMAFYDDAARDPGFPEELGATLVWLPRELGAKKALEERGWRPIFEGRVTAIWSRDTGIGPGAGSAPVAGAEAPRCFPGP